VTVGEFSQQVLQLCAKHGCSETSGFRTRFRNTQVGGHPQSAHLLGLGKDLVLDVNTPKARGALVLDAKRMGLYAADEDSHVHVQAIPPLPKGGKI
jgi:hypothetical protein